MSMMQGDAYSLGISILNNANNPVTPEDVQEVEITVGKLRKTFTSGEVSYYGGLWMFPVTQEETFLFRAMATKAQVRVVWADGTVEGKPLYGVRITESISKEVL